MPFDQDSRNISRCRECPRRLGQLESHRVLQPGGSSIAQQVGAASAFELLGHFLGPIRRERQLRASDGEAREAKAEGLTVTGLRIAD